MATRYIVKLSGGCMSDGRCVDAVQNGERVETVEVVR